MSDNVFSLDVPFRIRMALQVAFAAAEEITSSLQFGLEMGQGEACKARPVLLSIKESRGKDEPVRVAVRFERGIAVFVKLVNLSEWGSGRGRTAEDWVVVGMITHHYRVNSTTHKRLSNEKQIHIWDSVDLQVLQRLRPWWHPVVCDICTITGRVVLFNDGRLTVEIDPDQRDMEDRHWVLSWDFAYFNPGDRERAIAQAEDAKARHLSI